ncbi:MAG: glycoside hydrolase family 99-like domain-containing protein [Planctomycetes bacterium]|nr:glycoside hydrolase family 99-like domain-containing protein [Planctomycetota bacterium]
MNKITMSPLSRMVLIALFMVSHPANVANGEIKSESPISNSVGNSRLVIGAYYYPWYYEPGQGRNRWRRTLRQHLKSPQQPKAGLYRSNDPKVIGEHISQSVRAGISFWAVSWWGQKHHSAGNFRNAILKHPDAGQLKYAILYESTGRLSRPQNPDFSNWLTDLAYLEETFFSHPQYLRIEGKPVVFIYLSRVYFRDKGHEILKQTRERFPQIYLIGDDVFGPGYQSAWAKNFDAVTCYDVYGQSIGRLGATQKALDYLAENFRYAKAQANRVGTAFIPTVAPGYNDTAVRKGHPPRARYFTDSKNPKEGGLFRAMIDQVALPNLDARCGHIMMVNSFNEWYEDTQIEATSGHAPASHTDDSESGTDFSGGDRYVDYGYLYLDILRNAQQKHQLVP